MPVRSSDITVLEGDVEFRAVDLAPPLALSSGTIERFTVAYVHLVAADRTGRSASGQGATVLSVPWAWPNSVPDSVMTVPAKDQAMRALCRRITRAVTDQPAADPIRLWREISAVVPELNDGPEPLPALAALLCLGAVDSALHDVWSRIAGVPAYAMYDSAHLTDDLSGILGSPLSGRHPGDFFTAGRSEIPVQHLVSTDDPLTDDEASRESQSLESWLRTDGFGHIKVKVAGCDPHKDADRVAAVHRTALTQKHGVTLAVDPNEAYASPDQVTELLRALHEGHPETAAAVSYIEQPVPRGTPLDPRSTREGHRIPVLMDEGLSSIDTLHTLTGSGWDGLVIKAGKGQTHALLAHSYARACGLFVTMQDLTAVDLALRHSVRLASVFDLSTEHLEYNSRQYAAEANTALALRHPELTTVRDGTIRIERIGAPGIY